MFVFGRNALDMRKFGLDFHTRPSKWRQITSVMGQGVCVVRVCVLYVCVVHVCCAYVCVVHMFVLCVCLCCAHVCVLCICYAFVCVFLCMSG